MRYANVKDFKTNATRYIADTQDVVILKYGKPVAILSHVADSSVEASFLAMHRIVTDSKLTKKNILQALDEVRKDVYAR